MLRNMHKILKDIFFMAMLAFTIATCLYLLKILETRAFKIVTLFIALIISSNLIAILYSRLIQNN